ncbi:alcohol dehydrogenase catalytic domain-containing protein [uncultured Desulfuromusa sp.]|uniref:alcohol dehydrogenase catalytic domain-containing protein n=1 Tax=uncultured Desulfuromusa sp. TaxID=219183 RepID=UPI002AA7E830|nr:zinc-binding dehydrogenase [uncultured Desulfuromusa sp.]
MIPKKMAGVQLTGHGGIEKLVYRDDITVPTPSVGEVLVRVTATAKNNTDRKVREGLYSIDDEKDIASFQIGGSPTLTFPRIQGADVVGQVVETGDGVSKERIGERGLLDFNIYADERRDINLTPDYYGHGRDGGYAEYVVVPSNQFYRIDNPELADAQLAALGMCSYQTALHMLTSAQVKKGEHILVTGASGGVGTALIQLCRILGAIPHAVSSSGKEQALLNLGAESIVDRTASPDLKTAVHTATGGVVIDAVMDLVGGEMTNPLIDVLIDRMAERKTYPRLSNAGASAGSTSQILWSKIYLYQVHIFGVSHGTREEAEWLIEWIRDRRLSPVLHRTFRLSDIHNAENYFAHKSGDYIGKIALVPDSQWQQHGAPFAS